MPSALQCSGKVSNPQLIIQLTCENARLSSLKSSVGIFPYPRPGFRGMTVWLTGVSSFQLLMLHNFRTNQKFLHFKQTIHGRVLLTALHTCRTSHIAVWVRDNKLLGTDLIKASFGTDSASISHWLCGLSQSDSISWSRCEIKQPTRDSDAWLIKQSGHNICQPQCHRQQDDMTCQIIDL